MIRSGKLSNNKLLKAIIVNAAIVAALCLYYLLLRIIGVSCPVKAIFCIKCPTCGVTTAMLSLFCGDFYGYFSTQPFAVFIGVAVILEVNRFLFKKTVFVDVYAVTVAALNFIYYLVVNFFV